MRFAVGCFLSAVVLAGSGAAGIVGPQALPVAVIVLLLAAVLAAIAMEDRDDRSIGGLAVASAALREPLVPSSQEELPLDDVA